METFSSGKQFGTFPHLCLKDVHNAIGISCQSQILQILLRIIKSMKYPNLEFCWNSVYTDDIIHFEKVLNSVLLIHLLLA